MIHSRITGIYALKEACINDTIVRADCKLIGLHSDWNERQSSLCGVRETYLKVDFGLSPCRPLRWDTGERRLLECPERYGFQ
jgi:hypothetical protein